MTNFQRSSAKAEGFFKVIAGVAAIVGVLLVAIAIKIALLGTGVGESESTAPNGEDSPRSQQASTEPSTDLERIYREAEKASEENQYRERLISFIKRNYIIDQNRVVAHTGLPLSSSGVWSASDAAISPDSPSICSTSEVTCEAVTYRDDDDQVVCSWIIAVYNVGNDQKVYQNDAALFYFRKSSHN